MFLILKAAGGQQCRAARGASTVHIGVSPSCGELGHLGNVQLRVNFICKVASKCGIKGFLLVILFLNLQSKIQKILVILAESYDL